MNNSSGNNIEHRKKDSARLIWDTKPKRAPNPKDIDFQTAEIVIPNPHRDQVRLPTFMENIDKTIIDKSKMNRLIWGDNLLAMQALLASGYEKKINLIYIDPPFWTDEDYYFDISISGEKATKSPSLLERLAFKDIWEGGIDSYLDMLFSRIQLMKRLLADNGSIYVHLDWHVVHYVKIMLDEIFGQANFVNEIVWQRKRSQAWATDRFGITNDTILLYSKTGERVFNPTYSKKDDATEKYIRERFVFDDGDGRNYMKSPLINPLPRPNLRYEFRGILPPPTGWLYSKERMEEMYKRNELVMPKEKTSRIYRKIYLDKYEGQLIQNIWADIPIINPMAKERIDFPTQKPEALLSRIIGTSSNEGDVVADFCCGSGTTLVTAEKMKRKWIGCDFSKVAIQVTRNRLVQTDAKPFLLENIGNYQRHMAYLSGVRLYEMQRIILKLYGATPREDLPDLGTRELSDGTIELIFVSYPDRPVTAKKVEEIANLADKLDGKGYKRLVILGWDYEYNYEELLKDRKKATQNKWKTEIDNKTIPPEVYEYLKTVRTEDDIEPLRGKIHFHEKPYLKLALPEIEKVGKGKAKVTVGIERYVMFDYPIEDEKQRQEIMEIAQKNYFLLVDYWAVDWDHDNVTFKSVWQTFRGFGKEIKAIPKTTTREVETGKRLTIAVRLVDVFGNDTSASQTIDLRGI
jgi:adenine-specific DNA-methyltransferase